MGLTSVPAPPDIPSKGDLNFLKTMEFVIIFEGISATVFHQKVFLAALEAIRFASSSVISPSPILEDSPARTSSLTPFASSAASATELKALIVLRSINLAVFFKLGVIPLVILPNLAALSPLEEALAKAV